MELARMYIPEKLKEERDRLFEEWYKQKKKEKDFEKYYNARASKAGRKFFAEFLKRQHNPFLENGDIV